MTQRGVTTQYTRNGFGDLTQLSSQDSGLTSYTYDAAGNLATKLDANGNTTTYNTYDALNRIKLVTYQDGTQSHYYYDSATNSVGRIKQIADPTPAGQPANTTYFSYDIYGNVTAKQTQLSGQTYQASYNPNTNQLTSETYDSGMVVGYKYDAAGQMNRVDINGSWFMHDAIHQPFGPVKSWTWGNGTGTAYARAYDLDGRLTGYPLDGTNTRTVAYDNASRVTGISDPAATQSIGYDANSRITSYTGPFGNGNISSITYDGDGNRTGITTSAGSEVDTITSTSNVLTQTKLGAAAAIPYTTDAAGNVTQVGSSTTYGYDARNRQSSETVSGTATTWYYDGLNERIQKLTPPPAQLWRTVIAPSTPDQVAQGFTSAGSELTSTRALGNYFWNGGGFNSVLQETIYLDHAGTAARFGAIPVGVNAIGGTGAHPWNSVRAYDDQQGTPRRLVDQNLNLFGKWDSDPFGTGAWNYNPAGNGAIYIDARFPGQSSNDAGGTADTTTYFNTTRNYYPNVGRYMQSDSIGLAGGINTYAYAGSNPANSVDPWGLLSRLPLSGPDAAPVPMGSYGYGTGQTSISIPPIDPLAVCELGTGAACKIIPFIPEIPPILKPRLFAACEVVGTVACLPLAVRGSEPAPSGGLCIAVPQETFVGPFPPDASDPASLLKTLQTPSRPLLQSTPAPRQIQTFVK